MMHPGKAPPSCIAASNKRKKSSPVQPADKGQGLVTQKGPDRGCRPPPQTGGKRKGKGNGKWLAVDELKTISVDRGLSVGKGGRGSGDWCRPTLIPGNRAMPGFNMSGWGRSDERSVSAAGPGAASKAARSEERDNDDRTSALREKRTLAAAAAATAAAERAAARYMRGEWTLPQPEVPLAPSPPNSTPIAQHHWHRVFGTSEMFSTASASEASMPGKSSCSGSFSHVDTTYMTNAFSPNRGAGAGVGEIPVAQRTSPMLLDLSAGGIRNSNSWLKCCAPLQPPGNTVNNNDSNSINGISSTSNNSNNSGGNPLSRAESFVSAFLTDDVRPPPIPFAPPGAWRMNSSMSLGQASRTSSAASMMMMTMFGAGVGAGVSTRLSMEGAPLPGDGGGRAGDGRELAATVAAAAAAFLRTQRAVSSSGGRGGSSSDGVGGGSGSPASVAAIASLSTSHDAAASKPAQQPTHGQAGNSALIEHSRQGNIPEQQVPVQVRAGTVRLRFVAVGSLFLGRK